MGMNAVILCLCKFQSPVIEFIYNQSTNSFEIYIRQGSFIFRRFSPGSWTHKLPETIFFVGIIKILRVSERRHCGSGDGGGGGIHV